MTPKLDSQRQQYVFQQGCVPTIIAPLVELCLYHVLREKLGRIPALCAEFIYGCGICHARRPLHCMPKLEDDFQAPAPVLMALFTLGALRSGRNHMFTTTSQDYCSRPAHRVIHGRAGRGTKVRSYGR